MLLPLNLQRKRRRARLRKYTILGFFSVSIVLFLFVWLYRKSNEQIPLLYPEHELTVGMHVACKPYEFKNEAGQPVGFDVDLAREIGKRLDKRVIFKDLSFDALLPSLVRGDIDLIISAMPITAERRKKVDMIPYYGKLVRQVALIFWQKIPKEIKTIDDFSVYLDHSRITKKPVISVQKGTLQEQYAQELFSVDIRTVEAAHDLILDIRYGNSIAALVPIDIITQLKEDRGDDVQVIYVDLPEKYWTLGYGIGLNKQNKKLYDEVEAVMEALQKEGVVTNFVRRWLW